MNSKILKFPIFQTLYIILWIPLGYIVSYVIGVLSVGILANILMWIFDFYYPDAIRLFALSGAMEMLVQMFSIINTIVIDLIFLIIGLELIVNFLNKKKREINEQD